MFLKAYKDRLILAVTDAARAHKFFPGTKVLDKTLGDGKQLCAIPHTLETTLLLRNKGLSIPAPIQAQYQWPGKHTPYPHQKETAGFLTTTPRGFCLNGMGTMKTASTIWAADFLMKQGSINRCLIVAPFSTLDCVWEEELFNTVPRRSSVILHGTRAQRLQWLEKPHDFYIINHDGLNIIKDALKDRADIDLVVIDEVAVYRHANRKRWKIANDVVNKQHPRWCWGLTGTPTPRAPTDAYGQMKLIKPENYRGYFTQFKNDTMLQVNQFRWVPRRGSEQVVAQVLSPSIRYALQDCVSLPPTIRQHRKCELSSEQQKHYKALLDEAVTEVGESTITAANAAVLLNKLIQVACGVPYDTMSKAVELDFGPRFGLLQEVIEESQEKVIVFVPLTGVLSVLRARLEKDWSVEVIEGGVSKNERRRIFNAFRHEKDPHVLLANPGTMSHGLNLTAATTIAWYAPIHSNDIYTQANARIVRPGQKNVTNIIHMFATTAEMKIYKALENQTALQNIVLELVKEQKKP